MSAGQRALLALAGGRVFEGEALGAPGEAVGEVVFNTAMSGYQEVLTDPSYKGQLVCMTAPHIGNTGVNPEDVESHRPWVEGFIVREASPIASSWRAVGTLEAYLTAQGIVGIQGIDTRALTRHLRDRGAQEGVISTEDLDPRSLVAKAKASPGLVGRDLVKEVTCPGRYEWTESVWRRGAGYADAPTPRHHVVAYDSGVKRNILRQLVALGCRVTVLPAFAPADEVLALGPDGLFLANGPGDPEGVPYLAEAVRRLLGQLPVFGICLGHQILALALGARTYKLPFGHHGTNHPVKDLVAGRVEITSQNHGFAVDPDSCAAHGLEVTHVNLNDGTCEGMRHRSLPVFSVQYHPEASPGPHDAHYLFRRFLDLMGQSRGR
ncbi:MAG TPA: glutamine-hydrolyzing carbamoyl-phosphate synthase small subunit [Methylomirabilota bacterium]|nr:glutamine-hydrolyzing carbamoyl-phosphate synthase small subunit [Methylomirabilota bacterium]